MDHKEISTIVFDMGQVLIHWNAPQILSAYSLSEEDGRLLARELFGSVEWVQLDHGTISHRQAITQVCRRLPQRLSGVVESIVSSWWNRLLEPMEGMGALVRELKDQGYGIYLLSNASVDLRRYFHRIPGSACFDGLMVSAEEKKLKPHYDIFYALYERFGLIPEACVFIDDGPANVEAAMCTGMHAIQFWGDVGRLRRELRALGVKVAEATQSEPEMV